MPNKSRRDKGNTPGAAAATRRKRPTSPLSAAALLKDTVLGDLTQQLALQQAWHAWLAARLPAPLPEKLAGVVERDGVLTVLAPSGAWASRLRYAVAELEPDIRAHAPALRLIRVRVMPRAQE